MRILYLQKRQWRILIEISMTQITIWLLCHNRKRKCSRINCIKGKCNNRKNLKLKREIKKKKNFKQKNQNHYKNYQTIIFKW